MRSESRPTRSGVRSPGTAGAARCQTSSQGGADDRETILACGCGRQRYRRARDEPSACRLLLTSHRAPGGRHHVGATGPALPPSSEPAPLSGVVPASRCSGDGAASGRICEGRAPASKGVVAPLLSAAAAASLRSTEPSVGSAVAPASRDEVDASVELCEPARRDSAQPTAASDNSATYGARARGARLDMQVDPAPRVAQLAVFAIHLHDLSNDQKRGVLSQAAGPSWENEGP
jgi:hypothetical protein